MLITSQPNVYDVTTVRHIKCDIMLTHHRHTHRSHIGTGRARAGHFSLASEERAGHTPFGLSNCTNYYVSVADSLLGSGRTHTATHRHSLLSTMTIESNRVRAQQHGLCVRARAAERASCHQSRPARHLGRLDQCVHDKMADGVATTYIGSTNPSAGARR